MGGVLAVVLEALHKSFALFARKLILSGEIIAVVCMVGWRLDSRLGLKIWPHRGSAKDLLAGSATVAMVLFVAFVRDFSECGPQPDFLRYAAQCIGVVACITLLVAMISKPHRFELLGLSLGVVVGIALIEVVAQLGHDALERIGAIFVNAGPWRAHHGLAAVLFVGLFAAYVSRRVFAKKVSSAWRVFFIFTLTALAQGFLAFRGVSALFILAVAGAVAWFLGWRIAIRRRGERSYVVVLRVSPALKSESGSSNTLEPPSNFSS